MGGVNDPERESLDAMSRAIALHGETHPVVAQCMQDLLKIARGVEGYRGRYIGDRYRAICRVLDMLVGKPREAPRPGRGNARGAIAALMDDIESDGD